MDPATLCMLVDEDSRRVLLGMKKRGFGKGKYNGFGGKISPNESAEDAASRELCEEIGVKVKKQDMEKVAEIAFFFPSKQEWNQTVHIFLIKKWINEPRESEEMTAEWFDFDKIPFDKMWKDDTHWLPLVLDGKKLKADCFFKSDNENIEKFKINEVESFHK